MTFEMQQAQLRLDAADEAYALLVEAQRVLRRAGVKHTGVAKALRACCVEILEYTHATEYAITKREKRNADNIAAHP